MNKIFNKRQYKERRQALRNKATDSEQLLWQKIRSKQLGVKFRRQHGIGYYIVDFYCPTLKLVIELDGGYHYQPEQLAYDQIRTEYLNRLGIQVLRYDNNQVFIEIDAVVEDILTVVDILCDENQPPPTPP